MDARASEDGAGRQAHELTLAWGEIDGAPVGIARLGADGRYLRVNAAFAAAAGVSTGALVGAAWSDAIHPDDRCVAGVAYATMLDEGAADAVLRAASSGADEALYILRLRAIVGASGEPLGCSAYLCDCSAELRAERQARAAEAAVLEGARALDELTSIAAHDLHEPLRKIAAFGQLLKDHASAGLTAEHADWLFRIQDAAVRMRAMLAALLTLARVPAGLPFARIDLVETAEAAVHAHAVRIAAGGARVEVGALPAIDADPFQMLQLFEALIDNALKFCRPGEPAQIRIEAVAPPDPARCAFTVRDEGVGFDAGSAERIFRPFERLHARGAYQGVGMGLAIARKVVERHGGAITAHGEPGRGATFTVVLPIEHAPAPRAR